MHAQIAQLKGHYALTDTVIDVAVVSSIPEFPFCLFSNDMLCTGAFGCTIGGAGPTTIAIVRDKSEGEKVAEAMCRAYKDYGGLDIQKSQVVQLDHEGARQA